MNQYSHDVTVHRLALAVRTRRSVDQDADARTFRANFVGTDADMFDFITWLQLSVDVSTAMRYGLVQQLWYTEPISCRPACCDAAIVATLTRGVGGRACEHIGRRQQPVPVRMDMIPRPVICSGDVASTEPRRTLVYDSDKRFGLPGLSWSLHRSTSAT